MDRRTQDVHAWRMLTSSPKPEKPRLFLREWRDHRNLTQEKLAERADLTQGMISQLENGQSDYTGKLLRRLADALSCNPIDLLTRDPSKPEPMWSIWDHAKPAQRRQIEEVAKALLKMGTE